MEKLTRNQSEQTTGSASLEGAEFTVKYYQTLSGSDPGEAGQSPERTWVFEQIRMDFVNIVHNI